MSLTVLPVSVELTSVMPAPLSAKSPLPVFCVLMTLAWFESVSVEPVMSGRAAERDELRVRGRRMTPGAAL